ncbi:Chaperone DnaJ-domain superfamily protein [Euphorbia peplus]|nr:Chaperone DnaJ-domain superfamily protein [Euphorbia peplus]
MARKGNQQRNGVDRQTSNHKKKVSDSGYPDPDMRGRGKASEAKVFPREEIPNGDQPSSPFTDDNKTKQNSSKFQKKEKQGMNEQPDLRGSVSSRNHSGDCCSTFMESPRVRRENRTSPSWYSDPNHAKDGLKYIGLHIKSMIENVDISGNMTVRNVRASTVSILKSAGEWLEKHRPLFVRVKTNIYTARDYLRMKVEQAYPVVLKWLFHFGSLMLLLLMFWLDFTLRGIDSFFRLGTTSFFSVIWCSVFSLFAMVGMFKFLIALAIAAFVGLFIGITLGLLLFAISGAVFLWLYGSFWTTLSVIIIGGTSFMLSHERVALLTTTVYSVYCAWSYTGWLGLLLALNLSFISSDVLIYFLKNNINQQRRSNGSSEQSAGVDGQPGFFSGDPSHPPFAETGPGTSDRSPGVPSTSGVDSEDEVIRLLNCTDHYSALGFARYENVDVSLLKKEYRKKAMLVHPDKNMGNEKAVEAFKKLQNAYEVLLDSLKRKSYDDELRREELLNYFRRFQSTSQKNGEHGFFASGLARSEGENEDPFGESRRIACKRCDNFHLWVYTKKSKSRARWCQDCKDYHQAKDGDGWVEQSSQPFFFGLLQKVDSPSAYVCADGKIYNATEWYICQGMRCPANTHKPSFHVNTSLTSKHNTGSKASNPGQRSSRMPPEETMTEEEFFEWLQNAVQAGVFENAGGGTSSDSPFSRAGNAPKNGGSAGAGGSSSGGSKRKKKGKNKW